MKYNLPCVECEMKILLSVKCKMNNELELSLRWSEQRWRKVIIRWDGISDIFAFLSRFHIKSYFNRFVDVWKCRIHHALTGLEKSQKQFNIQRFEWKEKQERERKRDYEREKYGIIRNVEEKKVRKYIRHRVFNQLNWSAGIFNPCVLKNFPYKSRKRMGLKYNLSIITATWMAKSTRIQSQKSILYQFLSCIGL